MTPPDTRPNEMQLCSRRSSINMQHYSIVIVPRHSISIVQRHSIIITQPYSSVAAQNTAASRQHKRIMRANARAAAPSTYNQICTCKTSNQYQGNIQFCNARAAAAEHVQLQRDRELHAAVAARLHPPGQPDLRPQDPRPAHDTVIYIYIYIYIYA